MGVNNLSVVIVQQCTESKHRPLDSECDATPSTPEV